MVTVLALLVFFSMMRNIDYIRSPRWVVGVSVLAVAGSIVGHDQYIKQVVIALYITYLIRLMLF
jgi:hypothetical protein